MALRWIIFVCSEWMDFLVSILSDRLIFYPYGSLYISRGLGYCPWQTRVNSSSICIISLNVSVRYCNSLSHIYVKLPSSQLCLFIFSTTPHQCQIFIESAIRAKCLFSGGGGGYEKPHKQHMILFIWHDYLLEITKWFFSVRVESRLVNGCGLMAACQSFVVAFFIHSCHAQYQVVYSFQCIVHWSKRNHLFVVLILEKHFGNKLNRVME